MRGKGVIFGLSVFIITIAAVLTGIIKHYNTEQYDKYPIRIDHVDKMIGEADSLRNSKPDSAFQLYQNIISQLDNIAKERVHVIQLANCYLGLANYWQDKGDFVQSLKNDSIAMALGLKTEDHTIQAKSLSLRGLALLHMGEYENALVCCQNAMDLATGVNNKEIQAKILANMAIIYFNQGDIPKTIEGFTKALEIGKQIKKEALIAGNYMNLATVYDNQSLNDSVLTYNTLALKSFQKINDKNGEIMCYRNIGNHYYSVSDFGKAIEYYQLSVNLAQAIEDKLNLAKNYNNLAEVFIHLGDYDIASDYLFKSIKIKELLDDKLSLAKGYSGLARIYFDQKVYSKAGIYFKKALAIGLEYQNSNQVASSLSSIGSVFSNENQHDSAIAYYNKSLKIYKTIDFKYGIANLCINLGDEYRIKKDYIRSEKLLLEALGAKTASNEEEGQAVIYSQLANLYLSKCEEKEALEKEVILEKAEQVGIKGYQIAKRLGALPVMRDAAGVLKQIYKKQGKYQQSLEYSETCHSLSDSILNEEKVQALHFAEARWNVEKKQAEIDFLENSKKLNLQIIEQQRIEVRQQKLLFWTIVSLFVLTFVLAAIATLYFRKRRDAIYQKQLAKMTALRMQNARNAMSPHFFFNVLASLSGLSANPEVLKTKLKSLSLLLRKVIENIDRTAVTIDEELSAVKAFVDLYRDKIPAPFNVEYSIDEGTKLQGLIPAMLIQIPVENAIKHGLMAKEGEKNLTISITDHDAYQQITVTDNGIGLKAATGRSTGTGTGLKVLLQTIHLLNNNNPEKIIFTVTERESSDGKVSGTAVNIQIPNAFNYMI